MKTSVKSLKQIDPEIYTAIEGEKKRQKDVLSMIPSENYASTAVMEAVGSVLMNKYAEGQVHKRYYQGNTFVDKIEQLCKDRALKAFGLSPEKWGANVQPHSGCPANLGVINGLLNPGDKIMAMFLPDGGHLSHGWYMGEKKVTLVSKIYTIDFYHVEEKTRVFNFDEIEKQAMKFKPNLIISGGTAYAREMNYKRMSEIAKKVGAYYLADIAHEAGLVVGKAVKSPFPYADVVTFTTHKTLRGPRGAVIIGKKELMEQIDLSLFPGLQGGPHEHSIAGIAVAFGEAMKPSFKKYAAQVVINAKTLAKEFGKNGYDVVGGGTDKHLVLLDLRSKGISAWIAAWALEYAGIILNRNTVPYDTGSPYYPSGIRMGTPVLTTRGMKEREMKKIAGWIMEVFEGVKNFQIPEDKEKRKVFMKTIHKKLNVLPVVKKVGKEVMEMTKKFPVHI